MGWRSVAVKVPRSCSSLNCYAAPTLWNVTIHSRKSLFQPHSMAMHPIPPEERNFKWNYRIHIQFGTSKGQQKWNGGKMLEISWLFPCAPGTRITTRVAVQNTMLLGGNWKSKEARRSLDATRWHRCHSVRNWHLTPPMTSSRCARKSPIRIWCGLANRRTCQVNEELFGFLSPGGR